MTMMFFSKSVFLKYLVFERYSFERFWLTLEILRIFTRSQKPTVFWPHTSIAKSNTVMRGKVTFYFPKKSPLSGSASLKECTGVCAFAHGLAASEPPVPECCCYIVSSIVDVNTS